MNERFLGGWMDELIDVNKRNKDHQYGSSLVNV
jgi:hypothetical protein